ncbi:hypothetical protein [Pseudolysinimonas sp.]|uniref:hypothetical protein n=1 Tax=Pseudolysinimonas sp. TaxID=2680009 RepID=UPI00286A5003|nr:hypothetical protein [Pseudolysinimonas sp.]
MSHDEDPPELRGYVPNDDRPLRHPLTLRVMRIVIVLGVIGLVVPGLYATIALQARTAEAICARAVSSGTIDADPVARFELFGPGGPSWYCYAREFGGREVLIGSLGLIPG